MRGGLQAARTVTLVAVVLVVAVPAVGAVDPVAIAEEATGQDLPEPVPTDLSKGDPDEADDEPYATCTEAERTVVGALAGLGTSGAGDVEPCRETCEDAVSTVLGRPTGPQVHDLDCPDAGDAPDPFPGEDGPPVPPVVRTVARIDDRIVTRHDGARPHPRGGLDVSTQAGDPVAPAAPRLSDATLWRLATVAVVVLVPLLVLYRRLSEDEILDNDLRRRIVDAVEDEPGVTAAAIARRLGVHYMTARYHLRVLDEFDEVHRREIGGRIKFFPSRDGWGRRDTVLHEALASKKRRRLVTALLRDGELAAGDLADRLECARSTASFHLDRLVESGILDRRRDGRSIRYRVCDDVKSRVVERIVDG